jgi:hypothetical protein
MVTWTDLLLPSAIATACVFVASALIHMVIKWHNSEYQKLPNEEEVRVALRRSAGAQGQYIVPHCLDQKEMADPAMQKKLTEGPNVVIYVGPTGMPSMGKLLGTTVVYNFIISLCAGYVAKAALGAGAEYLAVFQVVGAASFLAYSGQSAADSIWKYKPWGITFKYMLDGLIYAALTAGSFAWLWPNA